MHSQPFQTEPLASLKHRLGHKWPHSFSAHNSGPGQTWLLSNSVNPSEGQTGSPSPVKKAQEANQNTFLRVVWMIFSEGGFIPG